MNINFLFITLSFVISTSISFKIIPLLIHNGNKYNLTDNPSPRKAHKKKVVRIGGTSILLGYILSILTTLFFIKNSLNQESINFIVLISLGSIGFYLIGLIDDIFDISPFPRLSVQILFSFLIYASGISFFKIDDSFIFADYINLLGTIFWIVGITNAMNWFDGLDGLASGVSIITLSSFALIFLVNHNYLYALTSISLIGAIIGFLKFNFYPSKIIMGDCGSNLLGFNLATISMLNISNNYDSNINLFTDNNRVIISLLLLSIPLLDMTYVIFKRLKNKRSPFYPDNFHLHHRLMNIGFSHRQTVFLIYIIHHWPVFLALYYSKIISIEVIYFSTIIFIFNVILIMRKFINYRKINIQKK